MHLKKTFGMSVKATAILLITMSSCSQNLFRGYGYKGSTGAPDVRNEKSTQILPEPAGADALAALPEKNARMLPGDLTGHLALDGEPAEPVDPVLGLMVLEEAGQLAAEGKEINHRNLTKNLTQRLTDEGQMQSISPAQERKMSRLAAKMDKKMKKQGKEIDWKNNTGLELFFMIMSIGGLVLGIIGVGIGWFVFIVFAGLWLYFKLVKD